MVRAIHGAGIDKICCATVSDGTPGLFHLSDVTGDSRYARTATRAGDWILQNLVAPERLFYDFVDPATGVVLKRDSPFWPQKSHQTLFDVARPAYRELVMARLPR